MSNRQRPAVQCLLYRQFHFLALAFFWRFGVLAFFTWISLLLLRSFARRYTTIDLLGIKHTITLLAIVTFPGQTVRKYLSPDCKTGGVERQTRRRRRFEKVFRQCGDNETIRQHIGIRLTNKNIKIGKHICQKLRWTTRVRHLIKLPHLL